MKRRGESVVGRVVIRWFENEQQNKIFSRWFLKATKTTELSVDNVLKLKLPHVTWNWNYPLRPGKPITARPQQAKRRQLSWNELKKCKKTQSEDKTTFHVNSSVEAIRVTKTFKPNQNRINVISLIHHFYCIYDLAMNWRHSHISNVFTGKH